MPMTLDAEREQAYQKELDKELDALSKTDRKVLLRNIAEIAFKTTESKEDVNRASQTMSRMATLQVWLSIQADKQFAENMKVQNILIALTRRLLVLTVLLAVLTAIMIVPLIFAFCSFIFHIL